MKKLLLLALIPLLVLVVGCSDDDDPVGPGTNLPDNTTTSTWNEAGDYWNTTLDASDYDAFMGFSFTSRDTTQSALSVMATGWDVAFKREAVKLNGGASTNNGGDVEGADLGVVTFAGVTIADTAGVSWVDDEVEYFIDDWYDYNPTTHALTANRNVYSMVDASGEHYVKFQVDSLVGAAAPPDMGTVYITYFYQTTVGSLDLSGATTSTSFAVGSTTAYFDFSSGSTVTPATPASSTEWDLAFSSYTIMQNSGPTGSGSCRAFQAYSELNDPTDIDAFTAQPGDAPMFEDVPSSVLIDWYNYTGPPLHQLLSHEHVYLIRTGGIVYKLMIESYYANVGGAPTSGWYTFIWSEL